MPRLARLAPPLAAILLLPSAAALARQDGNGRGRPGKVAPADVPVPAGPRLRTVAPVAASPLLVGGTSNARLFGSASEAILNREFGYVTPGNDFKQTACHPQPGDWNWKKADRWLRRIDRHDQIVRLHAAVGPQVSGWAKDDARTPAELTANLEEYLRAVGERYGSNPRIRYWDVVNETVSRDGTWFGPRPGNTKWENPWLALGMVETDSGPIPAYIPLAFEIAAAAGPDLKLIYNQHGAMEPAAWAKVKLAVEALRARGLRVDGVGWQGHVDAGFETEPGNLDRLHALIDWCHARGLGFHVTENTVWQRGDATPEDQAATFAAIVRALGEHAAGGEVSWNAWQMRDVDTERAELNGCLFDSSGEAKPAYFAVRGELERIGRGAE